MKLLNNIKNHDVQSCSIVSMISCMQARLRTCDFIQSSSWLNVLAGAYFTTSATKRIPLSNNGSCSSREGVLISKPSIHEEEAHLLVSNQPIDESGDLEGGVKLESGCSIVQSGEGHSLQRG